MSDGRTIGTLYDNEKFNLAVKNATAAYTQNVMGDFAQSASGEHTRQTMENNIYSMIGNLPVEYYQMLENYIDGKPVAQFADFTGKYIEPDYAQKQTEKGLVELVMACRMGHWTVKDPEQAKRYYNERFPTKEKESPNNAPNDGLRALSPKEAIARAKAKRQAERSREKQSEKDLKAIQKENRKNYRAYMKGLKTRDREAYGRLKDLHRLEDLEQKKLLKLHRKVVKHNKKFGYLNELEQFDPEKRAFSEKEKAKLQKLRGEERRLLQARDEYRESLQALNKQRLARGTITDAHYNMRESQLATFDFTYRAMRDHEEMRYTEQRSIIDVLRAEATETAQTVRNERETAGVQASVRTHVDLQAETGEQEAKEEKKEPKTMEAEEQEAKKETKEPKAAEAEESQSEEPIGNASGLELE